LGDTPEDVLGPIDYLIVEFPGNKFNGKVLPALTDLIAHGTVRVLDLAFVAKDADGNITTAELEDLDDMECGPLKGLAGFLSDVVSDEELLGAGAELAPNSSAAILVWENTRAVPFVKAVRASSGEVIASGRLATADVLDALAATD
jgi:hypothetical protein